VSALSGRGVVLVTGTDTGVGKTWVGCGLVRALRASGRRVAVRKPAETGCARRDGELFPADAAALRAAAGEEEALATICPIRFEEPLAPAVAAERAGVAIDPAAIAREIGATARRVDVVVVEGAGGLLVPLSWRYAYADLAADLGAKLLVVVAARLGAINHTLLTLEVAAARGIAVAGLVVNHMAGEQDLATGTLTVTLRGLTDCEVLAEIGHGEDPARTLRERL
jgi:dethiobiotin synthetase